MLHISRLKLRNFKSFKNIDVPIPPNYICLAGPNGSGKCVDGDTEIFLADGTTIKIRDLVNSAMSTGYVEKMDDGYILQSNYSKDILCLNTKTLKVTNKKIAAFVKRKTPKKMLKVKTRSGREIIATEYHPFFILDNNEIRSIRADELKEKIRIAIPRTLPVQTKDTLFLELLDAVDVKDNIYVPYSEEIANLIRTKKEQKTWKEYSEKLGIPEIPLMSFVNSKQAILFPYLVNILRSFGFNNLEIAHKIQYVKSDASGGLVKVPWQNSNEFCRFLGYLLAEGSVSKSNTQIRLTNGSKEIIEDYVNITKNVFGLNAYTYKYKKGSYDIIINNVALRNILLKFGMSYDGSKGKSIPNLILEHSTNEQLSNLLSGLYSGDGYVSKSSVEITLKSKKLIKGIGLILLRLGIIPRITRITKRETRSNFVGSYSKISLFGAENFKLFNQNILMAHKEKRKRLKSITQKNVNPNVDLIEANSMIKTVIQDLGINVKKGKKKFPRLDAYCYNQCLPSRYGINHLLSNVFMPIAIQKNQTETLQKLQTLSNSHIFWDEIEKIEIMEPREEWVYDLTIGEHHNFIANGIFVHNSNVVDSVRFCLGETSLKSLRARKVIDLIHSGSQAGEVTIFFDGDEKYEVKRAIRKDGKILYKLNGRKTTRGAILDTLKKYNLDQSGRNIIAQGEVQRIVQMNGKERRSIIDTVAGISNFEDKKKEAMRELDVVDRRINDANLILGERTAFLDELGKEKEIAIKYSDSKKKLSTAKASLLSSEIGRLEEEMGKIGEVEEKINFNLGKRQQEMGEVEEKVSDLEKKRSATSEELQLKQKTSVLVRKIEELKASVASKRQMSEDSEGYVKKLSEEHSQLKKELENEKNSLPSLENEIKKIKTELKAAEEEAAKHPSDKSEVEIDSLKSTIDSIEERVQEIRESMIRLGTEIDSKNDIVQMKGSQLSSFDEEIEQAGDVRKAKNEMDSLRREAEGISKDLDDSFDRIKEVNVRLASLDRNLLELREKHSIMRVRASPSLANPALKFIADVRDSGKLDGIYGTVAELISFDSKYANAVEAAAGGRLLYVVVEDARTATEMIKRLKKAGGGRATFIPLNEIKVSDYSGETGALIKYLRHTPNVKKAIDYVFGETILVDDMAEARKLGIGKRRMVTLDGEIFERSGIISGGKTKSSVLAASQLKKLESELDDVKKEKESLINELESIREDESRKRSEKSDIEVKIKSFEMELQSFSERKEKLKKIEDRKSELEKEVVSLKEIIKQKHSEKEKFEGELRSEEKKLSELKDKFSESEKKAKEVMDETHKKRTEVVARASSFRAQLEGKTKELELRKKEMYGKEERLKGMENERKSLLEKINKIKREMEQETKELSKSEERVKKFSKEIEQLFETMKSFEEDLQHIGKIRGEIQIDVDRLNKQVNDLRVRRATTETRFSDIKAEYEQYKDIETINAPKDELMGTIREAEGVISSLGENINMAAIEMYDKKKAEIEDVQGKIGKLSEEREAIIQMISEIDERKKEAFFETFDAVSNNFKGMFQHIDLGEGYLYMDKPNDPFESGLYIKLKRHGTEHSLDSLSGGENTLVALMFIFALQFYKPSPFYILDEVDAALDKENSKKLSKLVNQMSKSSQFIIVSHNDTIMSSANTVLGVTRVGSASKLVGVKLESVAA